MCDYTRFITDTVSETFGLYVGVIYIQKGVELLTFEFSDNPSLAAGWLAVVVAMLFALTVYYLNRVSKMPFGSLALRKFLGDYGFALAIIAFTGLVHM